MRNKQRLLLVGSGSGRDIASISLALDYFFPNCNCEIDIAGFLTPWSVHLFDEKIEVPIKDIEEARKFKKLGWGGMDLTPYFYEPFLKEIMRKFGIKVGKVFVLSLHYDFSELLSSLIDLTNRRKYDMIIIVDVGGDFMAGLEHRRTLHTPLVDWICKSLFLGLRKQFPYLDIYFTIISPGVAGEIMFNRFEKLISKIPPQTLRVKQIRREDKAFKRYDAINQEINKRTKSFSYTHYVIKELLTIEGSKSFTMPYKKIYRTPFGVFVATFQMIINPQIAKKLYFSKIEYIPRNIVVSQERNLLEFFKTVKKLGVCGTEIDLSAVPIIIHNNISEYIFLITPSCHFRGIKRYLLLKKAIKYFSLNEKIDSAIVEIKRLWETFLLRSFNVSFYDEYNKKLWLIYKRKKKEV